MAVPELTRGAGAGHQPELKMQLLGARNVDGRPAGRGGADASLATDDLPMQGIADADQDLSRTRGMQEYLTAAEASKSGRPLHDARCAGYLEHFPVRVVPGQNQPVDSCLHELALGDG